MEIDENQLCPVCRVHALTEQGKQSLHAVSTSLQKVGEGLAAVQRTNDELIELFKNRPPKAEAGAIITKPAQGIVTRPARVAQP